MVVLALVAMPVMLLALLTGLLFWAARRAWRRGAWLEVIPVAAGAPWLGRVVWLGRALLVGRAFWRLGRPRLGRRRLGRRTGRPLRPRGHSYAHGSG